MTIAFVSAFSDTVNDKIDDNIDFDFDLAKRIYSKFELHPKINSTLCCLNSSIVLQSINFFRLNLLWQLTRAKFSVVSNLGTVMDSYSNFSFSSKAAL